jgi:cell division protein ZapB
LRQWLYETPYNNAYRCGGSTGLAVETAHLFPVYPRQLIAALAPEATHFTRKGEAVVVKPLKRQQPRSMLRLTVRTPPPIVAAMHAELETLEAKIRQVAELCHTLRRDNIALRQQLLVSQQDNKQLTTRLEAAKTRLQALLETLPEDD